MTGSSPLIMITLAGAAERLGLAPSTLRQQVHNGRLAATLVGKTWMVTEAEVERYRASSRGKPGRPVKAV
jgi:excisionase family DNA binding protein